LNIQLFFTGQGEEVTECLSVNALKEKQLELSMAGPQHSLTPR